ncbi:hypothetical protein ACQKWADRAFT_278210 [Trichoderma austrokoningii]
MWCACTIHAVPAVPASGHNGVQQANRTHPPDKADRSSKPLPETGEPAPPDWLPGVLIPVAPCFNADMGACLHAPFSGKQAREEKRGLTALGADLFAIGSFNRYCNPCYTTRYTGEEMNVHCRLMSTCTRYSALFTTLSITQTPSQAQLLRCRSKKRGYGQIKKKKGKKRKKKKERKKTLQNDPFLLVLITPPAPTPTVDQQQPTSRRHWSRHKLNGLLPIVSKNGPFCRKPTNAPYSTRFL